MNKFGRRSLTFAALLALALSSAMANADSYLYVEDAASATLTGPDDQNLRLTLNKVRDYVTAFTDRPIRAATAISATAFYDAWPKAFATSAPNVVVSHHVPGQTQPQNIVLTVANPVYDARKHTVSFDAVRVLQNVSVAAIAGYQTPTVRAIPTPRKMTDVAVFFDNTCIGYCP